MDDLLTTIVDAFSKGAAAVAVDRAVDGIKAVYQQFTQRLSTHVGKLPAAAAGEASGATIDPRAPEVELADAVRRSNATADPELVALARRVLAGATPRGEYNSAQTIQGSNVGAVIHGTDVKLDVGSMTFGAKPGDRTT